MTRLDKEKMAGWSLRLLSHSPSSGKSGTFLVRGEAESGTAASVFGCITRSIDTFRHMQNITTCIERIIPLPKKVKENVFTFYNKNIYSFGNHIIYKVLNYDF